MKKTIYSLIIISFLGIMNLKAQTPIVTLQHAGNTTVFYGTAAFNSAYTASASGDTIVLSAGTFTCNGTSINKQLKIIGSGCYTDSVTMGTTLNNNIYFVSGSENSSLEGVICTYIYPQASNIQIIRCLVYNIVFGNGNYSNDIITGNIITNAINFTGSNVSYATVSNNILIGNNAFFENGTGVYLTNNTIISYASNPLNFMTGCYIKNNVIFSVYPFSYYFFNSYGTTACTFDHNLFSEEGSSGYNLNNTTFNNNTFLTNYYPISDIAVFNSYVTVASLNNFYNNFSFKNDYHLQNPSLLGTDGTQVGMYGGTTPFQYRAIPSNPQIISAPVVNQTDANGILNVNIQAKAQNY